ncbi:MAG: hypothetical protein Salg2KO_01160 [Salibacteraceae bacterium]
MKYAFLAFALILSLATAAQDTVMVFKSSNVDLNIQGKNTKKTLPSPMVVTVDLAAMTMTIKSDLPEVKELFRNKLTQPVDSTMGELGDEFSLTIDKNIFAHFYLDDRKMILFTRNDIHPLKWGMMLKEVEFAE